MINNKNIRLFFVIFFSVAILSKPQAVMQYVKSALSLCYNNVIPSLFLFMVVSNYISASCFIPVLSKPFRWFARLMRVEDKHYPAYILLSFVGGFAVAAGLLKKMADLGYNRRATQLLSVSMVGNSFAFCAFAVGVGYLGNFNLGVMIFISTAAAGLITAFVMSFFMEYEETRPLAVAQQNPSLVESIGEAAKSMLSVCGFVVVFYCMCEVMLLYINNSVFKAILCAMTEVTSGALKVSQLTGANSTAVCLCISFLPACTLAQTAYFSQDPQIVKLLFFSRFLHIPISVLVFSVLKNLFPVAAAVNAAGSVVVKGYQNSIEISATLFVISVIFLCIFDSNKLFTKQR